MQNKHSQIFVHHRPIGGLHGLAIVQQRLRKLALLVVQISSRDQRRCREPLERFATFLKRLDA
jgi:hypothetical protein